MNKTILVLAMLLTTAQASATNRSERMLENSTVQTVANVVADLIGMTTRASLIGTTEENRRKEATIIQNDIQDYAQNSTMSLYLAEKIQMVQAINSELSEQDSIDALILATESILSHH